MSKDESGKWATKIGSGGMVSGHLSFITIWLSGMDLHPKALRR